MFTFDCSFTDMLIQLCDVCLDVCGAVDLQCTCYTQRSFTHAVDNTAVLIDCVTFS